MRVKAAIINIGAITLEEGTRLLSWDELQERFVRAIRTLTHSDCLYISRTLGVHWYSINNWRDRNIMPRDLHSIFSIIEWVENGKPTEKIDDEEMIPWLN